jgi:hypothetical protein
MSIIISDTININQLISNCISNERGEIILECRKIDDIFIGYNVSYIDGYYNILGAAGPQYQYQGLPLTGFMRFDSADFDCMIVDGSLDTVILHEMGHVLGIGTLWTYRNLLNPSNCEDYPGDGSTMPVPPQHVGSNANASLALIDPSNSLNLSYVAVEDLLEGQSAHIGKSPCTRGS